LATAGAVQDSIVWASEPTEAHENTKTTTA